MTNWFNFIRSRGLEGFKRFYGTYLGVVVSIDDPENRDRVLVKIPEVFGPGEQKLWALPKGVTSTKNSGYHDLPSVNDIVLISFRNGEPKPGSAFWEPGYYAVGELPIEFTKDVIGKRFKDGTTILYNDSKSELTITVGDVQISVSKDSGVSINANSSDVIFHNDVASISINDSGIDIQSDKPIRINGNFNALYSVIPEATSILDVSQIGVSQNLRIG